MQNPWKIPTVSHSYIFITCIIRGELINIHKPITVSSAKKECIEKKPVQNCLEKWLTVSYSLFYVKRKTTFSL